jgi:hypothetical protein
LKKHLAFYRDWGLGTREQKSGIRNQESGIRDQGFAIGENILSFLVKSNFK